MNYNKPALSFAQQSDRLIKRGLIVENREYLISILKTVNYYRLSAYWYPFLTKNLRSGEERFIPNTTLTVIWRRYTFDRKIRLLIMDALERVEVAILRTQMVEQFTLLHGPFGYLDIKNLSPKLNSQDHSRLLNDINEAVERSREEFIERFRKKYTSESHLPLWIAVEVMTFGQLFTLFRNLHRREQQAISQQYKIYPPVLITWLHTLNFIRNACAHHARLWNRELPIRPKIPDRRNNPEWHTPFHFDNRTIFTTLTLLNYLLSYIDPHNDWQMHFINLLEAYSEIPLNFMGIPQNWQVSPIWNKAR